jgi:hypothetical protein
MLGRGWKLQKALYGLRISPRLWQQEAAEVLSKLGLKQAPEDPCVFIGEGIIVFFYVDDILIASHRTAERRANQLESDLESHWELTDHGEAEWFLNIRIIRDRQAKKLWLYMPFAVNPRYCHILEHTMPPCKVGQPNTVEGLVNSVDVTSLI